MRRLRVRRPSPAMGVALLALAVALAGTAYAAQQIDGTLIKKGDVVSIKEAINLSGDKGIQSFDAALHELFKQGRISMEEALLNADSRANLEAKINFG